MTLRASLRSMLDPLAGTVALTFVMGAPGCILPGVTATPEVDEAPKNVSDGAATATGGPEPAQREGETRQASEPEAGALMTAAIAVPDAPCQTPGAQACAQHAGFDQLVCRDNRWMKYAACSGNTRCDTRLGPTQGTCQAVADGCIDKAPGPVCASDRRGMCDEDLLHFVEDPCPVNARCVDTGDIVCACLDSFELTNGQCVKVARCSRDACGPDGMCIQEEDDYHCACAAKDVAADHQCLSRIGVNGDGTVTDRKTKLTWEDVATKSSMNWSQAMEYCSGLRLATGGWRLPTLDELSSLLDLPGNTQPNTTFPDQGHGWYWSSTPGSSESTAWGAEFHYGRTEQMMTTSSHAVRCIR